MYKVLIVEDDRTNRMFYGKLKVWEEEGFVIDRTAQNGKEALEFVDNMHFDMYLVDVMMPVMNGLEFLKELMKCLSAQSYKNILVITSMLKNQSLYVA